MAPGPAGFAELLGGVEGDPAPEPNIVHGPVSELAHETTASTASQLDLHEPVSGPELPPVPGLSWQQQVDTHRADFGLAPIAAPIAAPIPAPPAAASLSSGEAETSDEQGGGPGDGTDPGRVARLIRRRAEADTGADT